MRNLNSDWLITRVVLVEVLCCYYFREALAIHYGSYFYLTKIFNT